MTYRFLVSFSSAINRCVANVISEQVMRKVSKRVIPGYCSPAGRSLRVCSMFSRIDGQIAAVPVELLADIYFSMFQLLSERVRAATPDAENSRFRNAVAFKTASGPGRIKLDLQLQTTCAAVDRTGRHQCINRFVRRPVDELYQVICSVDSHAHTHVGARTRIIDHHRWP
jgi:hypothetical protein